MINDANRIQEVIPGMVSTVIPVYNRTALLQEAVDSVLNQTYRNFEIIIVDDGSTDDTPKYLNALQKKNPETIRVFHEPNRGAGLARERGRLQTKGEFIQYLDSDDRLLPEKFEIQVAALMSNPDCGLAYGWNRLIDQKGETLQEKSQWTGKQFDYLFPALLIDRWWGTLTPLYRRTVCDAVGPWSDMRRGEDWEYEARVGAIKTKLAYCKHFVAEVRNHDFGRLTKENTLNQRLTPELVAISVRLQEALFQCALQAGVSTKSREMQHFSRWAFAMARQAAFYELSDTAQRALSLASKSSENKKWEINIFKSAAKIIGFRLSGQFCEIFDRFKGEKISKLSLKGSRYRQE